MSVSGPVFVGRQREKRALEQVLDPRRSNGRLAVVAGPAGVGKTTLVEEVLDTVSRECLVLWARADALDQDQPFAAVSEVIRAVGDSTWRDGTNSGAPEFVERLCTAVLRSAADRPIVIVADDFQWADPASWRVVRSLAAQSGNLRVRVVVIVRTPVIGDAETLMQRVRDYGAVYVEVGDLSPDEVHELVNAHLGPHPGIDPDSLVERSGGNALFVTELLRSLSNESTRHDAGNGTGSKGVFTVPASLQVTVMSRLTGLADRDRQLLGLAAMLGSRFSVDELSEIADRPVLDVVDGLNAALRVGVLAEDRHELKFSHALVAECIRDDRPLAIRQTLHRHIASVLARRGASSQRVAEHYVLAADASLGNASADEEAAGWLARASAEAQPTSLPTATNLLERAVRLSRGTLATNRKIDLAALYLLGGRLSEAEAACKSMLDDRLIPIGPISERSARGILAVVFALRGPVHATAAVEQFDAVLALAGPGSEGGPDTTLVAETLAAKALVVLYTGDVAGARVLAVSAVEEAVASGNRSARSRAHEVLALASLIGLDTEGARTHVEESLAWFSPSNGPWSMVVTPHLTASVVLSALGDTAAAERVCEAGLEICSASGHLMPRLYLLPCEATLRLIAGDLDTALRLSTLTNELIDDWCPAHPSAVTRAIVGYVAWLRGDPVTAERLVERAAREMWDSGAQVAIADLVAWLIASVYEGIGRRDDAFGVMHLVWSLIGAGTGAVVMAADLVRLAKVCDPAVADEVMAVLRARFAEAPTARNELVKQRAEALMTGDRATMAAVAGRYDRGGNLLTAAWAKRDLAVLLTHDAPADAEGAIRDAIRCFENMHAPAASNEMRALARTIGIAMRPTRSRPSAVLSEMEELVAALAREGLTNRQIGEKLFISARTAESHLTRVFAKLGVRNRVQLAALPPNPGRQP